MSQIVLEMCEKTDVTTPADHRIIVSQHCIAAVKVKCPPLERGVAGVTAQARGWRAH